MRRLLQFLKEARGEFKKVAWPTRKELVASTTLVIVVSVIFGVFLGLLDVIFFQSVYGLINLLGG